MSFTNNKKSELEELKKEITQTKRACSPELEDILFEPLKVLDHGFVRVVDYMGNDGAITQAARVSYGKGTKTLQNDTALVNYLMRHAHTSPFEMCEIKFHIKAPIFVARQWVRHRTANINEYSGRYSLMCNEFYVPEKAQLMKQSVDNKQGRDTLLSPELQEKSLSIINDISKEAFKQYEELLNLTSICKDSNSELSKIEDEGTGLSRELSRIILPLNTYTEFYWKIDLHNLLHFLFLRATNHAQYEIRVYAELMLDIVKKWVPIVYKAFVNYKQEGVKLSKEAHKAINDLLTHGNINKKDYKLTKREWIELEESFPVVSKLN